MFKPLVKLLEKFTLPLEGSEKLLKALVPFNPIIFHLLPLLLSNAKFLVFGFAYVYQLPLTEAIIFLSEVSFIL